MPAKSDIAINLLEQTDSGGTAVTRITTWAVTYGRYIMIGTEIVVLLAFIYRFRLDRQLTDLKEEIGQKQAILEANTEFEQEIRNVQDRLAKVKPILDAQTKPIDIIALVQAILPPDVIIVSLDYAPNKILIDAQAGSTNGFAQFLAGLARDKNIGEIEIGDIQKQPDKGIVFKISATIGNQNTQKK